MSVYTGNRSRNHFRKRMDALNKKNCKTAKQMNDVLKEMVHISREQAVDVVSLAILQSFGNLVGGTPVDTGRARAGWQIEASLTEEAPANGSYPEFQTNNIEAFKNVAIRAFQQQNLTQADIIYVLNNVEYILALNAGWSKQQPAGFIDRFLQDIKRTLESAAKEFSA